MPETNRALRAVWLVLGLACVGLGGLGVIVPGLPTTVFFIGAAACFTRCSPRLERWVLDLPGVGRMVRDHRAGLGMPRRAKVIAIASIVGFSGLAVWVVDAVAVRAAVVFAAVAGVVVVGLLVPTRERVLAARGGDAADRTSGPDVAAS